jgi:hypothetical protein
MSTTIKPVRVIAIIGVILLQLIMTQVVTFIVSFFFPGVGDGMQTLPGMFVIVLGVTFAIGVFLAGWLGIKFHWLSIQPNYAARLAGALVGAYLPLLAGWLMGRSFEQGSPWFFVSILGSILGFYLTGWLGRS